MLEPAEVREAPHMEGLQGVWAEPVAPGGSSGRSDETDGNGLLIR